MSRAAELEARRILGQYRRLVLLGKARLPLAEARRLVGPDCAFHLYFRHAAGRSGGGTIRSIRGRRRHRARRSP